MRKVSEEYQNVKKPKKIKYPIYVGWYPPVRIGEALKNNHFFTSVKICIPCPPLISKF